MDKNLKGKNIHNIILKKTFDYKNYWNVIIDIGINRAGKIKIMWKMLIIMML